MNNAAGSGDEVAARLLPVIPSAQVDGRLGGGEIGSAPAHVWLQNLSASLRCHLHKTRGAHQFEVRPLNATPGVVVKYCWLGGRKEVGEVGAGRAGREAVLGPVAVAPPGRNTHLDASGDPGKGRLRSGHHNQGLSRSWIVIRRRHRCRRRLHQVRSSTVTGRPADCANESK